MSKFSIITIILLLPLLSWGNQISMTGQLTRNGNEFLIRAKDRKGLTREYLVTNPKDFVYDCMRLEGQTINLKGKLQDKGLRSGTVELIEVTESNFNPLGI